MSCAMYYPHYDRSCKIDLHVHTTASDGAYDPGRVVELAWRKGIRILAITDHDTTLGLEEAGKSTSQYPLELIPGIEMSTIYHGHEVHILGYYIRPDSPELLDTLKLLASSRLNRARRMVDKLKTCGVHITYDDVMAKGISGGSLGRPHVALALIEKGIVKTIGEAFERFLNPGCPAYVPRYKLSPREAVVMINKAGGVAVLAHPGIDSQLGLLPSCIEAGLQGIEVFYPRHAPEMEKHFISLADKLGLIITGGSDYHGHEPGEWQYFGEMPVPLQSIKRLKELAVSQNPD